MLMLLFLFQISGDPESSYEKVREVAATRKRNTEQSLIDYMLRVHPKTYLFRQFEKRVREEARQAVGSLFISSSSTRFM